MARLSAAQVGKIRRLSQPKELSPDEEGGELNIVPFLDIIVNILIFVLATVAVTFTATIETNPPASRGSGIRQSTPEESLNLTILIVNDGFSIKASGGNIAPGCESPGPGITIPKAGGKYDYASLNKCAARLKKASPAFEDETQAFISANPGVAYEVVIGVADAVRKTSDGKEVLFDAINFKVSK